MAEKITLGADGALRVPDEPIIPFVEGDGIGIDIWPAARSVLDAAAAKHGRRIAWLEVLAGEKAYNETGDWLPADTITAFDEHLIGIKGPLTTPVGGGFRSLNVAIRQIMDLYVCLRPVRWFKGVPSPVREPHLVDMVIFRENTEDIYAGLEVPSGSSDAARLIELLHDAFGWEIRADAGVGIKPVSKFGSQRLQRAALNYAVRRGRKRVHWVHKGNIMKFTEGAFRGWGYELVRDEFADVAVAWEDCGGDAGDKILVQDTIADIALQQVLTRPAEFDVIATMNLNGDYISDALAAQVGGASASHPAPTSTTSPVTACSRPPTAPPPATRARTRSTRRRCCCPGALMFEHLGWQNAADDIIAAVEATISDGIVTYDFARLTEGATEVKCSEFAAAIIDRL